MNRTSNMSGAAQIAVPHVRGDEPQSGVSIDWFGDIHLWIDFCPPDRRHRDDDNIIAAFKAGRDGLADALGVDDKRFRIHSWVKSDPVRGGMVKIRLTPGPEICKDMGERA